MKIYAQGDGVFFCGKIKEVRLLLRACARRYRTVQELISGMLN
ncbi:MAG: Z-ring formation inhibitor MciZ [Peptococcaceae bacterium]|nr:Z-ring formation inhibitor MciZ [Peptococcaceae bacterium]